MEFEMAQILGHYRVSLVIHSKLRLRGGAPLRAATKSLEQWGLKALQSTPPTVGLKSNPNPKVFEQLGLKGSQNLNPGL